MTPDQAYVLGVLLGDGSVCHYKRNYVVSLTTTDPVADPTLWEDARRRGTKPRSYSSAQTVAETGEELRA